MIQRVKEYNANLAEGGRRITISMEFERPREALIPLMSLPDVVSRPHLCVQGLENKGTGEQRDMALTNYTIVYSLKSYYFYCVN